ncbi:MAG: hypothetical protein K8R87_01780 [Verrucomicrobia bacterium]|nr:hypothetical protein [Verrucomicrobiota bacterium]
MPLTCIVCPHCEQNVEVPTTSVTRSRECPNCGKSIILQLATRDGKVGRRALLTVPRETSDYDNDGASALTGRTDSWPMVAGPRDRLIFDPEVQTRIKQLQWGLVIFSSMIVLVVGNYYQWWSGPVNAIIRVGQLLRGTPTLDVGDESTASSQSPSEIALEHWTSKIEPQPSKVETQSSVVEPSHVPAPQVPAGTQLTDLETAKQAVANFLTAKTVDERLGMIRDRTINEKRMRSYYALHGDGPVAYERIEARDVNLHGAFTYTFNVVLAGGARREALVGKAKSGKYLVDWASFVLYSEMDWAELKAKRPHTGVMFRFLVTPANFYSGEFSDSEGLLCLKLVNPVEPQSPVIYGYLKKSETLGGVLKSIAEKSHGQAQPLMLKIAYPENSKSDNQVWITEFIGEGWIARNW